MQLLLGSKVGIFSLGPNPGCLAFLHISGSAQTRQTWQCNTGGFGACDSRLSLLVSFAGVSSQAGPLLLNGCKPPMISNWVRLKGWTLYECQHSAFIKNVARTAYLPWLGESITQSQKQTDAASISVDCENELCQC